MRFQEVVDPLWHTVVDQDLFMKLLCVLLSRALLKSSIFYAETVSPQQFFFLNSILKTFSLQQLQ